MVLERICNKRSGQTFIIGAVIVIVSLFTLSEALTRKAEFDPATYQGHDVGVAYLQIISALNQTADSSNSQSMEENLRHTAVFIKEEMARKEYLADIDYPNSFNLPLKLGIALRSPNVNLNKTETFN